MSSRRQKIQRLWQHDRQPSLESDSNEDLYDAFGNGQFQQEISDIGIDQLLELDPRPTFVLKPDNEHPFQPVFLNASLRSDHQLSSMILEKSKLDVLPLASKNADSAFKSWLAQIPAGGASPTFTCFSVTWTGYLVKHLVVVGGNRDVDVLVPSPSKLSLQYSIAPSHGSDAPSDSQRPLRRAVTIPEDIDSLLDSQPNPSITYFSTTGTPDWTVENPEGELSSHIKLVRSVDWASTPLGAMSSWSPEFRQIACLLMANPHSAAVFWGDELTVLYNQSYAEREAGSKHPGLMGTGLRGPFAEIWHLLGPIFDECRRTGKGFSVNDQMLPLERHGFLEETYYTWSLTPLYGGTKELLGFYNAPFETTRQIRSARALETLLKLGQEMALAQSVPDFWPRILTALSDNVLDFPFAILYSVVNNGDTPALCSDTCQCIVQGDSECSDNCLSLKFCHLEGTLGVPEDHPAAPSRIDLRSSTDVYIMAFRDAMHTGEPKLLSIKDGTLPKTLIENIEWRGCGEPCREAIVCPIRPVHTSTGEHVLGFLVIGVNPRREYDDDYQSFIQLLDRQLATSLASVTLMESEIRRSRNAAEAAAVERSRLSEELAVERSRLQRIAEVSQVGMFSIDPDGLLLEANHRWFEMTGHAQTVIFSMSWMETIHENSHAAVKAAWARLTIAQLPWTGELQLKKQSIDAVTDGEADKGTWITAACQPEFSDGQMKSVMGSITDISRKKWAEALQARRLQEAEEIRRQQNNFIDITSHEMRNPLSAILQCADGISSSLAEVMQSQALTPLGELALKECISSAETIQLCAQHQKSIVDDILTISKLDSNLLLITPVAIRPVEIVRQALQMFLVECQKIHDIKLEFHIDQSFRELGIEMILINLLTNAIKFTKASEIRTIDVFISAYNEPPTPQSSEFQYFPSPSKKGRTDVTAKSEWGNGEVVYLRFEVKDSGCGLKPEERKKLFNRFSQASPRTHVQYGGSGLGLFISRQLTELQGGEIGVASEEGKGSTFAFYVKARRPDDSQKEDEESRRRVSWDVQMNTPIATDSRGSSERQDNKFASPLITLTEIPETNVSDWHILIVEDNLVNQRILAQQIRKLGATVYVANHGGEALDLIQESKHYQGREHDGKELSVILMDLEMPVMDGLTCVRRIREMEKEGLIRGRLPIIAVTANARDEQIIMARDSGMDDVMPKPFRIVQIKGKIEALLKKVGSP